MSELLVFVVRLYQWTLRPFIGAHCRFEPSCSCYAIEALRRHGAFRGGMLSAKRVLRCNPWNAGGDDPVPPNRTAVHSRPFIRPSIHRKAQTHAVQALEVTNS